MCYWLSYSRSLMVARRVRISNRCGYAQTPTIGRYVPTLPESLDLPRAKNRAPVWLNAAAQSRLAERGTKGSGVSTTIVWLQLLHSGAFSPTQEITFDLLNPGLAPLLVLDDVGSSLGRQDILFSLLEGRQFGSSGIIPSQPNHIHIAFHPAHLDVDHQVVNFIGGHLRFNNGDVLHPTDEVALPGITNVLNDRLAGQLTDERPIAEENRVKNCSAKACG